MARAVKPLLSGVVPDGATRRRFLYLRLKNDVMHIICLTASTNINNFQ